MEDKSVDEMRRVREKHEQRGMRLHSHDAPASKKKKKAKVQRKKEGGDHSSIPIVATILFLTRHSLSLSPSLSL
jgi:hypothetical protein